MAYLVEFRPEALDDLEKIDRVVAQRILDKMKWFSENFEEITPQPLTGELKGLYKFRVGDCRIVYSINQDEELLTVQMIGHRREIYR